MSYLGPPPARTPVTSAQITDASVTAAKLATDSVTTVKIAAANVTTAKITDANVTTAKLAASSALTGKNLVTNGGANVSQRGDQTGQYNAYTAVDQFWFQEAGSVQARFTTTQNGSGGGGHANSLKLDCTTVESTVAAGDLLNLQHRIEAQHLQHLQWGTASAKDVTLSFWMSSPKTGTHCVSLYQADATRSYIAEFTIAVVNTFEYFSVTFPGDTGGTINDDTGPGLYVSFPLFSGTDWQAAAGSWLASQDYTTSNQQNLADNTSNNIFVTGVQLEVGSVVTDFEHEPISVTLAKCKRYFERQISAAGGVVAIGAAGTTTVFYFPIHFEVTKRVAPTVTLTGQVYSALGGSGNSSSETIAEVSPNKCRISASISSGLTAHNAILATSTGAMTIDATAEM